MSDTL